MDNWPSVLDEGSEENEIYNIRGTGGFAVSCSFQINTGCVSERQALSRE